MTEDDLDLLRGLPRAEGAPAEHWSRVQVTLRAHVLDGEAALANLLQDTGTLRLGWIVRTDAVLCRVGTTWCTQDGQPVTTPPWHRLLHADLAFTDRRGVRLSLLHDRLWHCQEVIEGAGEACLAACVVHQGDWRERAMSWGVRELRYRVYWALRPMAGPAQPTCYQPVASRWIAEQEDE